jgi:FixJ family two-component response regulator
VAVIAIIDDDAFVRESTADLISSLGHESLIFDSGEQFLASGRLADTVCIITDLQMPGLSGLDLQAHLQANNCFTPIIFITAYPKESARARALDAGAVAFLTKPYEEGALIGSLETALRRREQRWRGQQMPDSRYRPR